MFLVKQDPENNYDRCEQECQSDNGSRDYVYGPFAPVYLPRAVNSVPKSVKQDYDWETLASTHRPLCHNQALRDLFAHYMEALKSWYTEVAGNIKIPQVSRSLGSLQVDRVQRNTDVQPFVRGFVFSFGSLIPLP